MNEIVPKKYIDLDLMLLESFRHLLFREELVQREKRV